MLLSDRQLVVIWLLGCAFVPGVFAQGAKTSKSTCQFVGNNALEQIGDREGHSIGSSLYTCRVEGGAMDGGTVTGTTIYEWDKTKAVGLTGNGMGRKSGGMLVYELTDFRNELIMKDGKPAGSMGSGSGVYKLATGSAASVSGKKFTYTAQTTGPNQFVINVTDE